MENNVSFWKVLRSENIKFWSLRSNYFMLAMAFVILVGISYLTAKSKLTAYREFKNSDLLENSFSSFYSSYTVSWSGGLTLVVFVLSFLAAASVTNEYATGMIITSCSAYPKKIQAMLSKLLHILLLVLCFATLTIFVSYFVENLVLNGENLGHGLSAPGVLASMFYVLFYLLCITVIAFSIGFFVRNRTGSIMSIVGLYLLLPIIVALPFANSKKIETIKAYLPDMLLNGFLQNINSVFYSFPVKLSVLTIVGALLVWSFGFLALAVLSVKKYDV